jgi:glycosyltransferase involved in cell wall biosynthesis
MNVANTEASTSRIEPVELSVVVPFFNEAANVEAFFRRLEPVMDGMGVGWEAICVNDGSSDDTFARLAAQHQRRPSIKVVDFSRNFGKEAALSAGFHAARGQAVIPIDGDLQHPPELIPALVAKWREGFEMVYAVRRTRDDQDWMARRLSRGFYWLFDKLTDTKLPPEAGDFRLLDRQVVDVLNRMPERNRFMKGIFAWVGYKQVGVPFDAAERHSGSSKMRRRRLLRFAVAGITAFSNFPLRIWGAVGATISAAAFLYIVVRLLRTLIYGIDVPGYESLIMTILFLGGMQLLTLGIIGDYIGRMFDEVKGRPLYIVRRSLGVDLDLTS